MSDHHAEQDPGASATSEAIADRAAMNPGDQAAPGTPFTGENLCRDCGGSGRVDGGECRTCGGSGKVIEGISAGQ